MHVGGHPRGHTTRLLWNSLDVRSRQARALPAPSEQLLDDLWSGVPPEFQSTASCLKKNSLSPRLCRTLVKGGGTTYQVCTHEPRDLR